MASSSVTHAPVGAKDTPYMSFRMGGRLVEPALKRPAKIEPSTPLEWKFHETLLEYTDQHVEVESKEGIQSRERVLNVMGQVCREWIAHVCQAKNIPNGNGELFTSGSYRLGVHEPGADIDTILVAPAACERHDFFGTNYNIEDEDDVAQQQARDPQSLAERIRRHPDVTNFNPVETAAIPLLTFDWEGINIDLLFARLATHSVPRGLDIDDDNILKDVDTATEKSLNGPRVTNLIAAACAGTPERYQNFLQVVRCLRKWAKARGLYSNKMGYWGGVNINISAALVVQLYPNACPATLLRMFFLVFSTWKWPRPVMLTEPHDAGLGLAVWNPQTNSKNQVAPMITPAYPAMNSTLSVSRQTLRILQQELERGHQIVHEMYQQFQMDQTKTMDWARLFQPSDFFIEYPNYLSVCIVGPTQTDAQAWAAFVESRLRKLVADHLSRSWPLQKIQLWPHKIQACVADKNALVTLAQRQNSMTYFIGFAVDPTRVRGDFLNAEMALSQFREWELGRFHPLIPGMDILINHFRVKELPGMLFVDAYGTKLKAMQKRRIRRDQNPQRLARKAQEELQALKDEMERKLEERKSKRAKIKVEDDVTTTSDAVVKSEAAEETALPEELEETNLLESALQDGGVENPLPSIDNDDLEDVDSDDDMGYTGDGARQYQVTKRRGRRIDLEYQGKRCLAPTEESAELIRALGCAIVTDDESKIVGTLPPKEPSTVPDTFPTSIVLKSKFDLVELDSHGHVIDKGDEDYTPSKGWIGRKAGFEFKLGERGLGYYRTGKPVQVPSNTAY